MQFTYRSLKGPFDRVFPPKTLKMLRQYLTDCGYNFTWTYGMVQNCLLDFKDHHGDSVMINHCEPIFVYLCREGQLWPEDEDGREVSLVENPKRDLYPGPVQEYAGASAETENLRACEGGLPGDEEPVRAPDGLEGD